VDPFTVVIYRNGDDEQVSAMQLTPGTWLALAQWSGGIQSWVDGNHAVVILDEATLIGTAKLGDFVLQHQDGVLEVVTADEYLTLIQEPG
jgi:hypothetical protein